MTEFKVQLEKGSIQKAYRGLMDYIASLRTYLKKKYPAYSFSSNIYLGYMDMTYFSIVPESLKNRNLKIALVFTYETFQFEVWLSGVNRDVQEEYWKIIQNKGWDRYSLTPNPRRDDYILAQVLVDEPDFSDMDAMTAHLEKGITDFIDNIEAFLA
jgi:hypothetical protein